jgi:hypothetical protein
MPLTLQWRGPFSFRPDDPASVFRSPLTDTAGLYLWAIPTSVGYLVQRVGGTAKPFWHRHYEYLIAYRRGEYPIHRAASLAAGRRDPIYRGQLANRRDSAFEMSRRKFEPELKATLALLAIFIAPLEGGLQLRQRLEAAILRRLAAAGRPYTALLEYHRLPAVPVTDGPLRVRSVMEETVNLVEGEFEC